MENKQDLVYKIIKDRLFDKRNEERKKCRSYSYASGYYTLCNELGIKPEDPYLYEQGQTDLMGEKF